jgi:hypothetical protein
VDLEGEKTYHVNFGGEGRPVTGTVVQPELPKKLSWLWAKYTVTTKADAAAADQQKYYSVKIEQNGDFRIEDVPPGTYEFSIALNSSMPRGSPGTPAASVVREFTVPADIEAQSDHPLDIGKINLIVVQASSL